MNWTQKLRAYLGWDLAPKILRRIIVGVLGSTVLLIGIALIVLPGPAFIVIPLGLVILASEFAWARRLLRRAKGLIGKERLRKAEKIAGEKMP